MDSVFLSSKGGNEEPGNAMERGVGVPCLQLVNVPNGNQNYNNNYTTSTGNVNAVTIKTEPVDPDEFEQVDEYYCDINKDYRGFFSGPDVRIKMEEPLYPIYQQMQMERDYVNECNEVNEDEVATDLESDENDNDIEKLADLLMENVISSDNIFEESELDYIVGLEQQRENQRAQFQGEMPRVLQRQDIGEEPQPNLFSATPFELSEDITIEAIHMYDTKRVTIKSEKYEGSNSFDLTPMAMMPLKQEISEEYGWHENSDDNHHTERNFIFYSNRNAETEQTIQIKREPLEYEDEDDDGMEEQPKTGENEIREPERNFIFYSNRNAETEQTIQIKREPLEYEDEADDGMEEEPKTGENEIREPERNFISYSNRNAQTEQTIQIKREPLEYQDEEDDGMEEEPKTGENEIREPEAHINEEQVKSFPIEGVHKIIDLLNWPQSDGGTQFHRYDGSYYPDKPAEKDPFYQFLMAELTKAVEENEQRRESIEQVQMYAETVEEDEQRPESIELMQMSAETVEEDEQRPESIELMQMSAETEHQTEPHPDQYDGTQQLTRSQLSVTSTNINKGSSRSKKKKTKFECVVCQRMLSSRTVLKEHMYIHTGERPHVCGHCQKTFSHRRTFMNHEKTHLR